MRRTFLVSFFTLFFLVIFCSQGYPAVRNNKDWSGDQHRKTSKKHGAGNKHRSAKAKHSRGASGRWKADRNAPVKTAKAKEPVKQAAPRTITAVQPAAGEEENEYIEYQARKGDTFDKLANRFSVDKQDIIDLNKLAKKRLKPGTTVFIPKAADDEGEVPIAFSNKPLKPWKSEEERGILVKVAKSFAGAPYRYGGDSVRGLDCSAFVKKMYEIFEVQLPRSAREQYCTGARVDKEELATGDLVFFRTKKLARYPSHVGIYIGEGTFIHASSVFKRGVKVDHLGGGYFERHYMGAVRVMAPPQSDDFTEATDQEPPRSASNHR